MTPSIEREHHTTEHRRIRDRGAPRFAADGHFIGFYGARAELSAAPSVSRIAALRDALHEIRDFADSVPRDRGHCTATPVRQTPPSARNSLFAKNTPAENFFTPFFSKKTPNARNGLRR